MNEKIVTFSFDDGVRQDARVMTLLKNRGFAGTFNVNSGKLGLCERISPDIGEPLVAHDKWRADELKDAYAGFEVAAHTVTHPNLREVDDVRVIEEVVHDYMRLSELAGYRVVGMAYPSAPPNYDERVIRLIRQHTSLCYARAFLSTYSFGLPQDYFEWRPTVHIRDPKMDEVLTNFSNAPGGLLYIWGHAYELDMAGWWDRFERMLDRIAGIDGVISLSNADICKRYGGEQ